MTTEFFVPLLFKDAVIFQIIGEVYAHWSHGGNDSSGNANRNA